MKKIAIVLGSIRKGRQSPKLAMYFKDFITKTNLATTEIIDLKEYQFPLFEERLRYLQNPPQNILDFATKIKEADAIIIVSPEYNGSFPASLKNVIDLLKDEWFHKPIGLATVSSGNFGGLKCQIALQQTLQHMKALVSPVVFPVPNVETEFDKNGIPADVDKTNKRADVFVKELLWLCEKK
jgi:NAD(P)H-dependent FMN reductase